MNITSLAGFPNGRVALDQSYFEAIDLRQNSSKANRYI
jgi:hypothetical protein